MMPPRAGHLHGERALALQHLVDLIEGRMQLLGADECLGQRHVRTMFLVELQTLRPCGRQRGIDPDRALLDVRGR